MTNVVCSSYVPRPHSLAFHARSERFSVVVLHRRAGKTVMAINDLVDKAIQCQLMFPKYAYIAPFREQAKSIAWQYLKHYAAPLIEKVMESELSVLLKNGAIVRLFGADNPDALRGNYFDGVVIDEYAQIHPMLYGEVIAATLADRKGWCVFMGTPHGKNHFYDIWEDALANKHWFTMLLRASESGIIDEDELELLRTNPGTDSETFMQEYECSFTAAVRGAYYSDQMEQQASTHEGVFPYDPNKLVMTAWDIGYTDDTSVWFAQANGDELSIIDFFTVSGFSVDDVLGVLRDKPYAYGTAFLPHDAKNKSFQTGKSTREQIEAAGLKTSLVPSLSIQDGIQAVRKSLPKWYFNTASKDVRVGVSALKAYEREYDKRSQMFRASPKHNWCFTGDAEVLTADGRCQIMNLPYSGLVLTLCGWKQYTNPRVTRKNASLVEVVFADGYTVRCTPDHTFLTDSGWKSAESLTPYTTIQSSLTKSRNTLMGSFIAGIQKLLTLRQENLFTGKSGSRRLAKSLLDAISTTKIAMQPIINCLILSALMLKSICLCQLEGKIALAYTQEKRRQNGIDQRLEGFGINGKPREVSLGRFGLGKIRPAINAAISTVQLFGKMAAASVFAQNRASRLTIMHVKRLESVSDVWCLTVPDAEHFSLANGAIVHNCSNPADAARMLALATNPTALKQAGKARIMTQAPPNAHMNLYNLFAERERKKSNTGRI